MDAWRFSSLLLRCSLLGSISKTLKRTQETVGDNRGKLLSFTMTSTRHRLHRHSKLAHIAQRHAALAIKQKPTTYITKGWALSRRTHQIVLAE